MSSNTAVQPSKEVPRKRVDPSDPADNGPYKRQRTALACNSCRYRKSRCNGEHPICGTCTEMGFDCVYQRPVIAHRNTRHDHVVHLETRLQLVEKLLKSIVNNGEQISHDDSRLSSLQLDQGAVSPLPSPVDYLFQDDRLRTESPHKAGFVEDTVDGMGTITFADEPSSGYFGPSSNPAFFDHIARALASVKGTDQQRIEGAVVSRPVSPPIPTSRPKGKTPNPHILPPRGEILRLIELFFSTTGQFFPYIHKKAVVDMVEEMDMVNLVGARKSWLGLLNALLAIGSSLDDSQHRQIKFRESESDVFLRRALELSPWTILSNTANLETCMSFQVDPQVRRKLTRSYQCRLWRS